MASVTKNEIPNEAKMIGLLWEMIKEFYVPENSPEYDQAFCNRAREIDEQCNSRLGQKLINAYGEYLDEKYKEQQRLKTGGAAMSKYDAIPPDVRKYYDEQIKKHGISRVPGHYPVLTTKDAVDQYINITVKAFEDYFSEEDNHD